MFSFRTTALTEQLDKALTEGAVACFCTTNCWWPDSNCYMWEVFRSRGNLVRLFTPREAELTPGTNHIDFTPADLEGLNAVVVEIQDTGSRYFNYTKDVMKLMEALAGMKEPPSMYVVDHINPAGRIVEGTMPESSLPDYRVEAHTAKMAHRHGLTLGEICNLYYSEIGAKFPLHIISALATDSNKEILPWAIAPCSDIPGLFTCDLYSGGGLWNNTNITPGIGTSRPYEYIGAPFIRHDGPQPPAAEGVSLRPCSFTPSAGRYEGKRCQGYQLMLRSGATEYHSLMHTLELMRFFKEYYPEFRLEDGFKAKLADLALMDFILGQSDLHELREYIKVSEQKWIRKAKKFLLYEDQPYRIK